MSVLLGKISKLKAISSGLKFCSTMCSKKKSVVFSAEVVDLFHETFSIPESEIKSILHKNSRLRSVTGKHLSEVLQALKAYDIDKDLAIEAPAVLVPHAESLTKRGRILRECGVENIKPLHLALYFRLVKNKTIAELKDCNVLPTELNVRKKLSECFECWRKWNYPPPDTADKDKTIIELRFIVLQKYLEWRLDIDQEKFDKMIKTYNRFRHSPLASIERSITLAQKDLQMTDEKIRANPFFICADPDNTLMILNKFKNFNGIDAREAIKTRPPLIREDYRAILKIRKILKEHNMPDYAGKRLLPLYLLKPENLEMRLAKLELLPEYQALAGNRRIPLLAYNSKIVLERLKHYNTLNKHCATLQSLITSRDIFDKQMANFGDKNVSSDIVCAVEFRLSYPKKEIRRMLSQNSNWLHISTVSIVDTMAMLLEGFTKQEIYENCHIVLYSRETIESHLSTLLNLRKSQPVSKPINADFLIESEDENEPCEQDEFNTVTGLSELGNCNFEITSDLEELPNIDYTKLSNSQILAMAVYLIERVHCFTGDGIWSNDRNIQRNNA